MVLKYYIFVTLTIIFINKMLYCNIHIYCAALTNCYEIKYLISIFVRTELALLLRRSSSSSHWARLDFFLTFFVKKVSSENRISATKYCKVNYFVLNFNLSPTLKKVLFLECELAYICQMACNKHFWT